MRTALLSQSDQVGITGTPRVAGMMPYVEQDGVVTWGANMERVFAGRISQRMSGSVASNAIHSNFVKFATGTGATIVPLAVSGKYPAAGQLQIGTSNTGIVSVCGFGLIGTAAAQGSISLSSTSGTWTYEVVFRVPTNSDGTDTFAVYLGFTNQRGAIPTDGVYLKIDANTNANFQFVSSKTSVRTTNTTSIAITAGTWYRARIVLTNDTQADLYLKAYGTAFGASDSTITTNIPTATTRMFGIGIVGLKSAGTTSRNIDYVYQSATLSGVPTFTAPTTVTNFGFGAKYDGDGPNIAAGNVASCLGINVSGALAYLDAYTPDDNIPVYAYCKGIPISDNWAISVSGTGAAASSVDLVDGQLGVVTYTTGTTSTGRAAMVVFDATTPTLFFDADSGTITYEVLFKIPTLSTSTQKHTFRVGFADSLSSLTPANGAWLEIESNANGNMQCKTATASTVTTTDSGVTISADTLYWAKIVVATNASVKFYLKANGTALGAAVATHTTNIPTAAVFCHAAFIKSVGTTSRTADVSYQVLHARRI